MADLTPANSENEDFSLAGAAPDFGVPPNLRSLRAEVAQWCMDNVPPNWTETQSGASEEEFVSFQRDWASRLHEAGYLVPSWPQEWGGSGLSLEAQLVIIEELAYAEAPRVILHHVALDNIAPTLLAVATEEQKRKFLPRILNGEVWCQGFSEPDAGSDLASLRTKAERQGDVYIVNGQKVWTTMAQYADWCALLVRTGPNDSGSRGISYLALDMRSDGVEVQPIRSATGGHPFCSVYLTDVQVPVTNRLGDENDGWRIAHNTLAAERAIVLLEETERLFVQGLNVVATRAREHTTEAGVSVAEDAAFREEFGMFAAEAWISRLLARRLMHEARGSDRDLGPQTSVVKLFFTDTLQEMFVWATGRMGPQAQRSRPLNDSAGFVTGDLLRDTLESFAWTIGAGTSEIQRNIIAERLLGLPRFKQGGRR